MLILIRKSAHSEIQEISFLKELENNFKWISTNNSEDNIHKLHKKITNIF